MAQLKFWLVEAQYAQSSLVIGSMSSALSFGGGLKLTAEGLCSFEQHKPCC